MDVKKNGNGTTIFRWAIGFMQAVLLLLLAAVLNGQSGIADRMGELGRDISVLGTRLSIVEPVVGAYSGLTNRTTALETIANENSRRMTDNARRIEQLEGTLERRIDQLEKRLRELERATNRPQM